MPNQTSRRRRRGGGSVLGVGSATAPASSSCHSPACRSVRLMNVYPANSCEQVSVMRYTIVSMYVALQNTHLTSPTCASRASTVLEKSVVTSNFSSSHHHSSRRWRCDGELRQLLRPHDVMNCAGVIEQLINAENPL